MGKGEWGKGKGEWGKTLYTLYIIEPSNPFPLTLFPLTEQYCSPALLLLRHSHLFMINFLDLGVLLPE